MTSRCADRPRRFLPALVLAILAPSFVAGQGLPEHADEYRVKAAILYNLAKFVDWPSDAFPDSQAALVVCVLGTDPFGSTLDEALRGHMVGGRSVAAKRVADVVPGCHLMFIASSERKRLGVIIDKLKNASVLTVSEGDEFTKQGGMIGLTTEGDRVRFDINSAAAERAHLKVSARLLALASGPHHPGVPK